MPVPPPKAKSKATPSSKDLVPVGPRVVASTKHHSKRDENGDKPTTARALILRNGKHGARGTGELVLVSKLSGREKLDLLAEDLVERSKKAVMAPFKLEKCLKIAESQCTAYLDDIAALQDPLLFSALIEAELRARAPINNDNKAPDPLKNPSYIASTVSTRIHNSYMLASGWKLVAETLLELAEAGLLDYKIKNQLKTDPNIRLRYLNLYDMVKELVELNQTKVSVLATTTPHYHKYFKKARTGDPDETDYVFDWAALRDAGRSFLDSIVIELCFPRAPYPRAILYQILHDAVEESPKEALRFPQALWDAVGDLSVSVELQEFLEASLAGPDGVAWKQLPREMPQEYQEWVDAQFQSEAAADRYGNFKDIIFPLAKTKSAVVLGNMWKFINLNYKAQCDKDIDTLWQLHEVVNRTPQWHSFYLEELGSSSFSGKKSTKKTLAITNGDDSDGSMPELQSVSNSSDTDSDSDSDSDSDMEYDDDDAESGYNTEEEDELRELLREAMDAAVENDLFQSTNVPPEIDPFSEEDRKGNPFLKLLGSLRGRVFNSNPKLRTADKDRAVPRNPKTGFFGSKTPTPSPFTSTGKDVPSKPAPATSGPQSLRPTVEEVEDEDDVPAKSTKKKKKQKKKKKSILPESSQAPLDIVQSPPAPAPSSVSPNPTNQPRATPAEKATSPKTSAPAAKPGLHPAQMSTASLLPVEQTTAQSARSYLQSEHLNESKVKIKSRPDHASLFSAPEKEKKKSKSFLSRLGVGKSKEETEKKGGKHSWFAKLSKKTAGYMHQLLRTSEDETRGLKPMKWEHFLKVMREMGFQYDPSTAGSSVRFDPPDPKDESITFHRPHPDPTIQPVKLREYAKRLQRKYGWSESDFLR